MAIMYAPPSLQQKLNALRKRIRTLRAVQGVCRVVLILAVVAFGVVLIDGYYQLSVGARSCLLGAWALLAVFETYRTIVRPLKEPIDAVALAATVEAEFPHLDERLTTATELLGHIEPANGSPGLISEVIRETEGRTGRMDFRRAAPARGTLWFAVVSMLVLVTILSPLAVVQGAGDQVRRFFQPWRNPAETGFRIVVSSGNTGVARGDTVTLAAYLVPTRPDAELPQFATLIARDLAGALERLPMRNDQENVFFLQRSAVAADFDYRVEAGAAQSDWFHVTAVEPITVTESHVRVRPPAYAAAEGERIVDGLTDLAVLQHSRLTFELRLARTPAAAWMEWTSASERLASSRRLPLEVNAENRATLTVPAQSSGQFQLVLEAEHGVQIEYPAQPLQVRPDLPPVFARVKGITEQPRSIRPGEPLRVACAVADDIAVNRVELEHRINGGQVEKHAVSLRGEGTPRAGGAVILDLAGKLKDGDLLECRLVATDNRNVPEAGLGPQMTYYPTEGKWSSLRASSAAAPLGEQEIAARKQAIDERINELVRALTDERASLRAFKTATLRQPGLRPEQEDQLAEARGTVRETGAKIGELARDVSLSDGLAPLAAALRDIESSSFPAADAAMQQAVEEAVPEPRNRALDRADQELNKAIGKLETLRPLNERLAADQLDRQRLAGLSEDQKGLADRAAKADAAAAKSLESAQLDLEERLRKLVEQSSRLRDALGDRDAQAASEMAEMLKRLASQQRDLAQAIRESDRQQRQGRFADLLRRQQKLAEEAERLAQRTLSPTRAAQVPPLDPQEARLAREAIENDKPHEAAQRQEKAAFELDRLAGHLEGAATQARDPREAARQLARLQEDLQQRIDQETKGEPFAKLPAERRRAFANEQESIGRTAEQLTIPGDFPSALARRDAVEQAARAAAAMGGSSPGNPDAAMSAVRDALNRTAERLPALEKRLAAARQELNGLRMQQETINRQVDQAARGTEKLDPEGAAARREFTKKLGDAARRQADLLEKLRKLDVPTQEARQLRAIQAAESALSDLKDGLANDAHASQFAARRELDRLDTALAGQKPADEKAEELAKRQRDLAAQAEQAVKDPSKAADLLNRQGEIIRELQVLPAADAPILSAETLEKARRVEDALRNGPMADTARLARDAANSADALAAQLAGRESDAAKAARLAQRQSAAADEAEKRSKKPLNAADLLELRKRLYQMGDELRLLRSGPPMPSEQRQALEAVLGAGLLAGSGTSPARDKQKALESLQQAQQPPSPDRLAKLQRQAADSLRRMAARLAQREATEPETLRSLPRLATEPTPLPSATDAGDARRLAQQQRKLRDELIEALEDMNRPQQLTPDNPLGRLQALEEEIAKQADALAKSTAQQQGLDSAEAKEAALGAKAANEAARNLQSGMTQPALDAGKQTADRLRQLGKTQGKEGKQAEALARRQEDLNGKIAALQGDPAATRTQQLARQEQLRQEAERAAAELAQLAGQLSPSDPKTADSASQAAESARSAGEAMKGAITEGRKNQREAMAAAQERAAKALDQAAMRAGESAKRPEPKPDASPSDVGKALEMAMRAMRAAREQLGQGGKPGAVEPQMRRAADALGTAAQSAPQAGSKPGKTAPGGATPGGNDGSAQGAPDLRSLGPDAAKYAGRPWGELPGEVRTRLLQDWTARYGADYARNIRYYFEQLAERQ